MSASAAAARDDVVARACREKLLDAVAAVAATTAAPTRCIILSGGVDTAAIMRASADLGVTYACAITVLCGPDAPDRAFAAAVAAEHGLAHHVVEVTPADLIAEYLPSCVESLRTFDGMTLRNALVVAAALRRAAALGMKDAVVGDGADELLGGYSFTWGEDDPPGTWRRKRDEMCATWTFATAALAAARGVSSRAPFTSDAFARWATAETDRADCVGVVPIRLTLEGDAIEHVAGKLPLRRAFDTVASWRRKDPIEVGSGVAVVSNDAFWSEVVADDAFEEERDAWAARGVVIKNKEHLVNFRAYVKAFGGGGGGGRRRRRRRRRPQTPDEKMAGTRRRLRGVSLRDRRRDVLRRVRGVPRAASSRSRRGVAMTCALRFDARRRRRRSSTSFAAEYGVLDTTFIVRRFSQSSRSL